MSFVQWLKAGFTDLIPVAPPGATLSPLSRLRASELGKCPAVRTAKGVWTGFDWRNEKITPAKAAEWDEWGANIGLRATNYPGLDIDCEDKELVDAITELASSQLGITTIRYRENAQKLLLPYRTDEPFRRMRLWFKKYGQPAGLVEVLGDGQQYVIEGMHPSGVPYLWVVRPPSVSSLPLVTAKKMDEFLRYVAWHVKSLDYTADREGGLRMAHAHGSVNQDSLKGDFDEISDTVRTLPNTPDTYPGRDDYLRMGYAIKAALGEEGLPVWNEWCSRWHSYDAGSVIADWGRMVPPYSVGANWIMDQARLHGSDRVADEFGEIPVEFRTESRPSSPSGEGNTSGAIPYSDAWIAARCVSRYGKVIRYCGKLGGWLYWDGQKWTSDSVSRVASLVAEVCREAGVEALQTLSNAREAESTAKACASDKIRRNVMAYVSINQRINVPIEAFDADPWLLNTPTGVVDLRTGTSSPATSDQLFTRCTAMGPGTSSTSRWEQFLNETTRGDTDLMAYLQRLAGYSLTGSTREHVLAFFWGPGGNGKGVFLNTLVRLLGSYASVAAMDTFTSSRYDRHPTELAALFGARLVTAQETQEGRAWDEAKVKSITGGDPISARYMRQDFFTFEPQFKLLFAGNHKPRITNLDDAMRRRFHLVPFIEVPEVRDTDLADHLRSEWPAILEWAIAGCLDWQRMGLSPPPAVLEATNEYFVDQDPIGLWLQERTASTTGGTETRDLFADWKLWCGERNERPGTDRTFVEALKSRGLSKWNHPKTRRNGFAGVALQGPNGFSYQDLSETTLH